MKNKIVKHTKGPWIIDDNGTDNIENMVNCLSADKNTEREWISVGISDVDGYAESVAYCHPKNGHLIAAAPEQYRVLLLVEDVLSSTESALEAVGMENARGLVRSTLIAVREVITSAEGRE